MAKSISHRDQLLLPLLETIQELGGHAPVEKVVTELGQRLNIPAGMVQESHTVDCGDWGSRKRNHWRQTLHWVRLNALYAGLIEKSEYGYWTLSQQGKDSLHNCQPGLILIVFETPQGQAIWADALTAAGALQDDTLQLLFTSPPYPLAGRGRKYGNYTPAETIELIVNCAKEWRRALHDKGSVILNLRDCWLPKAQTGGVVRSLYQEKLLIALVEDAKLFFADRFYWRNPCHLPDNTFVTIHKVRTNLDVEQLFWLAKSPNPKADNREVLVDAAPATIRTYLGKARRQEKKKVGPSGQNNIFEEQIAAVHAGEKLKVIPRNLLEIANGGTYRELKEILNQVGLPRHDAMMPAALAEFFIRFLTKPGDLVYDPFHGSGTTALAAEKLGRKWIGSDRSLGHVLASAIRLRSHCPSFNSQV